MFSELPHDVVFKALYWLFDRFIEVNNTDTISLQRTGKQGVLMV
jgi:hypothetical protein